VQCWSMFEKILSYRTHLVLEDSNPDLDRMLLASSWLITACFDLVHGFVGGIIKCPLSALNPSDVFFV